MKTLIYSPVPAVLTHPERLAELTVLMTRVSSGCRVTILATDRPILAVHGNNFSYRAPDGGRHINSAPDGQQQIVTSPQKRVSAREWFYQVWSVVKGDL